MFQIYYQGILFNPIERKSSLEIAVSQTLAYGVDVVAARTPVDTGLLKSQTDSDDTSIFNDTYYSIFQELGTKYFSGRFFFENSIDSIEKEFISQISEVFE